MKVEDDCTLPGHPEVFVVGDLVDLGELPGVSQVAIQSGRHAADTIRAQARGRHDTPAVPLPRLRHDGDDLALPRAWLRSAGVRLAGFPAWLLWLVVHLGSAHGFQAPPFSLLQLDRRACSAAVAPSASSLCSRCSGGTPWQRNRRLPDRGTTHVNEKDTIPDQTPMVS